MKNHIDKKSSPHPNKSAMKKVMIGMQFVVAAAKLADVYIKATPYMFKLNVILKFNNNHKLMKA